MKKHILILLIAAAVCLCSCSKSINWSENVIIDDQHIIKEIPSSISAKLPPCTISEEDVKALEKSDDSDDKKAYELYINNYNSYGRYDGLEVGIFSYGFYETSNGCGFLLQNYGTNQASAPSVSEIYYYDGKEYTLVDSTGDNAIMGTEYAICDGEKLYCLISDGTLRAVFSDGTKKDYKNAVDCDEYFGFLTLRGKNDSVEILDVKKCVIAIISV